MNNKITLSDARVAFHRFGKFCFIPEHNTVVDTTFGATDKALQNIIDGHQDVFVIENNGELIVVHESEATIQQEVTLQATSDNHGWKAIIFKE